MSLSKNRDPSKANDLLALLKNFEVPAEVVAKVEDFGLKETRDFPYAFSDEKALVRLLRNTAFEEPDDDNDDPVDVKDPQ